MFLLSISPKFNDIDGLGHVNNTVIPCWFEQARNDVYRFFNPQFDFTNWNLILARFEVDFLGQMFFDKDITIRSYISHIGHSSFDVYQEAWQNNKLCAKGKTVLVHFNFKEQKSEEIPANIKILLESHSVDNKLITSN